MFATGEIHLRQECLCDTTQTHNKTIVAHLPTHDKLGVSHFRYSAVFQACTSGILLYSRHDKFGVSHFRYSSVFQACTSGILLYSRHAKHAQCCPELIIRICVKVERAVLGLPIPNKPTISVDIKHHCSK